MDHIFREKVYESTDCENGGGRGNTRDRANAALGLGITGTVLGAAALLTKGGIGGILGGLVGGGGGASPASSPSSSVTVNAGAPYGAYNHGCCSPSPFYAYSKECDDYVDVLKTVYGLKIGTMEAAQAARDVDIAEKFGLYQSQINADFGLYINNRDNIDRVNNRITNELFSLYKYTRDKDDETSARLSAAEKEAAVNSAVRPYQDKLIMCKIDEAFAWLKNYVDTRTCRMIEGVNVLPLTPEVTGVYSQNCCNQFRIAAAGAGGAAAA